MNECLECTIEWVIEWIKKCAIQLRKMNNNNVYLASRHRRIKWQQTHWTVKTLVRKADAATSPRQPTENWDNVQRMNRSSKGWKSTWHVKIEQTAFLIPAQYCSGNWNQLNLITHWFHFKKIFFQFQFEFFWFLNWILKWMIIFILFGNGFLALFHVWMTNQNLSPRAILWWICWLDNIRK